jgi:parvulin-like peptidyl-prolyl isomerase
MLVYGPTSAHAQIVVDRLLAVVNGQVVTAGDLDRYRALATLMGDEDLPSDPEALLARVIEDHLIRIQVAQFPGVRVTDDAVDGYAAQLESRTDEVDFPLTDADIRRAARERLERARYFDFRFQRSSRATDEEVRDYYENVFVPAAEQDGLDVIPALETIEGQIRSNVIAEKTQESIAEWTATLYRRNRIEVVE